MKYLPILGELFESDSVIFMLIGLVIAIAAGIKMSNARKNLAGAVVCFAIYAVCEVVSQIRGSYLQELLALFIGTIAIGGVVGFMIGWVMFKIRGMHNDKDN